ncbi:MAG: hypothetical protein R3F34_11120 [Planctomycetota bacterium]
MRQFDGPPPLLLGSKYGASPRPAGDDGEAAEVAGPRGSGYVLDVIPPVEMGDVAVLGPALLRNAWAATSDPRLGRWTGDRWTFRIESGEVPDDRPEQRRIELELPGVDPTLVHRRRA